MSISIISEYDEMYFQHIDAHDFNDFKFDYVQFASKNSSIYTTNKQYIDSIKYLPYSGDVKYISIYEQEDDKEHVWLSNLPEDSNL
jgi:hypothetical protein